MPTILISTLTKGVVRETMYIIRGDPSAVRTVYRYTGTAARRKILANCVYGIASRYCGKSIRKSSGALRAYTIPIAPINNVINAIRFLRVA